MFFSKKKNKKPELLEKSNILVNCKADSKEEVIRRIGKMLVDSGYVKDDYIDGMLKREETFATNIGNEIAIPHGIEDAKKQVKKSGIAVMAFPDGVIWNDDEKVRLVIGIAGVGDEHLEILGNIAENFSTIEEVDKLIDSNDINYIYKKFTQGV
ncbi:PTS sugar transporter subunit IIA [Clostridium sp.]|uniref:PTS sugar transporter subunit IIA n=1 Tax=Clostridium sp. TaxID=1506 RepID=UPI002900E226|nr:PTS sugar transporter subunit IIA [Clostridium sp.]MDU7259966.1 PTS sugar transporter subunit IIA [Clostridium butyricum]MDU1070078.1 PTS sugar transporter subunit IIA [Clostridium sp.]MDU2678272.1 PTS sugar transporter subunit IIA [Clostridium sp.]MDU4212706.1 PTS sugar transporter subunit IIA [Clostridium sp.]MDU5175328.1 PTS sugar transporter subunit IIA [Clostridium sp.]